MATMMVYVFEDDEHLRGSIVRALEHEGYEVRAFDRVFPGVALVQQTDVVVTNGLRDWRGWMIPDVLCLNKRIVPVVQITADPTARRHTIATAMLRKPFDLEVLCGAVAEACDWSRRSLAAVVR